MRSHKPGRTSKTRHTTFTWFVPSRTSSHYTPSVASFSSPFDHLHCPGLGGRASPLAHPAQRVRARRPAQLVLLPRSALCPGPQTASPRCRAVGHPSSGRARHGHGHTDCGAPAVAASIIDARRAASATPLCSCCTAESRGRPRRRRTPQPRPRRFAHGLRPTWPGSQGKYRLGRKIGSGSFGDIYIGAPGQDHV